MRHAHTRVGRPVVIDSLYIIEPQTVCVLNGCVLVCAYVCMCVCLCVSVYAHVCLSH